MGPKDARAGALLLLSRINNPERGAREIFDEIRDTLAREEQGLFRELSLGVLREEGFLRAAVEKVAAKRPGRSLEDLLHLSLYQLWFLDRVPSYAVYSEAKRLASERGFAQQEARFLQATLKNLETRKDELLALRRDPASVNLGLLDTLTVRLEGDRKGEARERALRACLAMRERPRWMGYLPPGSEELEGAAAFESEIAPDCRVFSDDSSIFEVLRDERFFVQGESSQWACAQVADWMLACKRPLRVLEMSAGRGGKTQGTVARLLRLAESERVAVPEIDWVAADMHPGRIAKLENEVVPRVDKWTQGRVRTRAVCVDWESREEADSVLGSGGAWDLIWLDAPCSGLGTLAKHPEILRRMPEGVFAHAKIMGEKQRRIAQAILPVFRKQPGAALFYTVCTLSHPETQGFREFIEAETGAKPLWTKAFWPGSAPAPQAEGFWGAFWAPLS